MPDQVTIIIICLLYNTFFQHYYDCVNFFCLLFRKIAGTLVIMLRSIKSRHHVFHRWFHA